MNFSKTVNQVISIFLVYSILANSFSFNRYNMYVQAANKEAQKTNTLNVPEDISESSRHRITLQVLEEIDKIKRSFPSTQPLTRWFGVSANVEIENFLTKFGLGSSRVGKNEKLKTALAMELYKQIPEIRLLGPDLLVFETKDGSRATLRMSNPETGRFEVNKREFFFKKEESMKSNYDRLIEFLKKREVSSNQFNHNTPGDAGFSLGSLFSMISIIRSAEAEETDSNPKVEVPPEIEEITSDKNYFLKELPPESHAGVLEGIEKFFLEHKYTDEQKKIFRKHLATADPAYLKNLLGGILAGTYLTGVGIGVPLAVGAIAFPPIGIALLAVMGLSIVIHALEQPSLKKRLEHFAKCASFLVEMSTAKSSSQFDDLKHGWENYKTTHKVNKMLDKAESACAGDPYISGGYGFDCRKASKNNANAGFPQIPIPRSESRPPMDDVEDYVQKFYAALPYSDNRDRLVTSCKVHCLNNLGGTLLSCDQQITSSRYIAPVVPVVQPISPPVGIKNNSLPAADINVTLSTPSPHGPMPTGPLPPTPPQSKPKDCNVPLKKGWFFRIESGTGKQYHCPINKPVPDDFSGCIPCDDGQY